MNRSTWVENSVPGLSIAIQAGGRSLRMGRDKGSVVLGSATLIEHVLEKIARLGDEILITSNHPQAYSHLGLPVVADREPRAGALEGLRTALENARGDYLLVVACDMPFLNRSLLSSLIGRRAQADVVVPHWNDRYQTMHAVYAREPCLEAVLQAMSRGERRMISFYPAVKVLKIPEPEIARIDRRGLSFFNINTPEDLQTAERILAEKSRE